MNDLVNDYKHYYHLRYGRVKGNPLFPNLEKAEKALCEAMESCTTMEEIQQIDPSIVHQCAVAQAKDVAALEYRYYSEREEAIRALPAKAILDSVGQCTNANEVAAMNSKAHSDGNRAIALDEAIRNFDEIWRFLDEVEIYENADIPIAFRPIVSRWIQTAEEHILDTIQDTKERVATYDADWQYAPERILEKRHLRLLSYKTEHVQEMVEKAKKYTRRKTELKTGLGTGWKTSLLNGLGDILGR